MGTSEPPHHTGAVAGGCAGQRLAIELLEHLGARWYRAARALAPIPTARIAVVGEVADRFRQARRVLNHIADRYLFPPGSPWFTQPAP